MDRWPTATCASAPCSNLPPAVGSANNCPLFPPRTGATRLSPGSGRSGRAGNGDTPRQNGLETEGGASLSPRFSRVAGNRPGHPAPDPGRLDAAPSCPRGNFGTGFPGPPSPVSNRPASHPSGPLPALPQLRSPAGRTGPEHGSRPFPGQRLGQRAGSRTARGESALPDGPRGADAAGQTDRTLAIGAGHPPGLDCLAACSRFDGATTCLPSPASNGQPAGRHPPDVAALHRLSRPAHTGSRPRPSHQGRHAEGWQVGSGHRARQTGREPDRSTDPGPGNASQRTGGGSQPAAHECPGAGAACRLDLPGRPGSERDRSG